MILWSTTKALAKRMFNENHGGAAEHVLVTQTFTLILPAGCTMCLACHAGHACGGMTNPTQNTGNEMRVITSANEVESQG